MDILGLEFPSAKLSQDESFSLEEFLHERDSGRGRTYIGDVAAIPPFPGAKFVEQVNTATSHPTRRRYILHGTKIIPFRPANSALEFLAESSKLSLGQGSLDYYVALLLAAAHIRTDYSEAQCFASIDDIRVVLNLSEPPISVKPCPSGWYVRCHLKMSDRQLVRAEVAIDSHTGAQFDDVKWEHTGCKSLNPPRNMR